MRGKEGKGRSRWECERLSAVSLISVITINHFTNNSAFNALLSNLKLKIINTIIIQNYGQKYVIH